MKHLISVLPRFFHGHSSLDIFLKVLNNLSSVMISTIDNSMKYLIFLISKIFHRISSIDVLHNVLKNWSSVMVSMSLISWSISYPFFIDIYKGDLALSFSITFSITRFLRWSPQSLIPWSIEYKFFPDFSIFPFHNVHNNSPSVMISRSLIAWSI